MRDLRTTLAGALVGIALGLGAAWLTDTSAQPPPFNKPTNNVPASKITGTLGTSNGGTGVTTASTGSGGAVLGSTGTATPTIAFGGASVGITYTTQVLRYSRYSDRATFSTRITMSAKGSSTGAMTIEGVPIAANATAGSGSACAVVPISFNTTITYMTATLNPSGTSVNLWKLASGAITPVLDTDALAATDIVVTCTYGI